MLEKLTTEARNPASAAIDQLTTLQVVQLMNREDATVAEAVRREAQAIAAAVDVIADRLRRGGRLVYVGAGTSGRLGVLDAAECPPTFNTRPDQVVGIIAGGSSALTRAVEGAEDHPQDAVRDLEQQCVGPLDCVVGIATSGRTPYVIAALRHAQQHGAYTVALACNRDSELAASADLVIAPIVGPEVISGSTRLKAGTATKLVLNTLTTATMIRLGKTYGNLMVDLRATNQKLRLRTSRIVCELTNVSEEAGQRLLDAAGGELKTAVVMQLAGLSAEQARVRLEASQGRLREAIAVTHVSADDRTLLLGIDGGGSSTSALLARCDTQGWSALGHGEAGPSNLAATDPATALANLDTAVAAAFQQAGCARRTVARACLALAGSDRPAVKLAVDHWARQSAIAEDWTIVNDAQPLLAWAPIDQDAIALISGTGSLAWGRNRAGQTTRAGGWGPLLGDEGSGYWIAVQGLRAAVRQYDGRGPATQLSQSLPEPLRADDRRELPLQVRSLPRDRLAALAPWVEQAAEQGDAVARQILDHAAQQLAALVLTVARQLSIGPTLPLLVVTGGVLLSSQGLRQQVVAQLEQQGLHVAAVDPQVDPTRGAVELAYGAVRR
jgi:N-acetylmuramic acid 6-phosphate etherase